MAIRRGRPESKLSGHEDRMAALQRLKDRIARKDARIVQAIDLCTHTDEDLDALVREGKIKPWQKRVAVAARQPRSEVMFGLLSAHERHMSRIRREFDNPAAHAVVNIAIVSMPERQALKADAEVKLIDTTVEEGEGNGG